MNPAKLITIIVDCDAARAGKTAEALKGSSYANCRCVSSFLEFADLLVSDPIGAVIFRGCTPAVAPAEIAHLLRSFHPVARLLVDSQAASLQAPGQLPEMLSQALLCELAGLSFDSSDGPGHEERERSASTLCRTPHPVLEFDSQGQLQYLNPAAIRLAGRSALLPSQFHRILPHNTHDIVLDCLGGHNTSLSVEAQGEEVNGHSVMWSFRAPYPLKVVHAFGTELTSYIRAQADLVRSEANFRALVESLNGAIVRLSHKHIIEYISPQWKRIWGHPTEVAIATPFIHWVFPEDAPLVENALESFFSNGRTCPAVNFRVRHADGTLRWLSASGSRMDSGVEERPFLTLLVRDVTHVRQLEDQLRHSQKMEAIGLLASGVAHSFNNLLTGISGFVELAMVQLDPATPVSADLREVRQCTERGANLTRQLLAFSHQQQLDPHPLSINDLIASLATTLRQSLGRTIALDLALSADLQLVNADPGLVEQAVTNLAMNAKDAMPSGGNLRISTQNVTFDEEQAKRFPGLPVGSHCMIEVRDTGCGMQSEIQERVFDPYFSTRKEKGAGLGLAITYGIVKQHGGAISLASEPGKGTAFRIYLPAFSPPVPNAPWRPGETIVIVEQDKTLRDFATRVLRRQGYQVLTAETPEEARSFLNGCAHHVALLLTEEASPLPPDFSELFENHPHIRRLSLSSQDEQAEADSFSLRSGETVLHKPFSAQRLLEKVRQALSTPAPSVGRSLLDALRK